MASSGKGSLRIFWTGVLILLIVLMVPAARLRQGWSFIAMMVLMLVFVAVLGVMISGRLAGILINERNLISLSRFQTVLWTVIILSAFLAMALARIRVDGELIPDPLGIALDWRLWALMGISTTSLIGTPLIQSTKKTKPLGDAAAKNAEEALTQRGETEVPPADTIKNNAQGTLFANEKIEDARFTDMFEGDEVGNTAYIDLAKVQMFFFTLVAVLSYGVILFKWIAIKDAWQLSEFPILSEGFIAILGISHGGYLLSKASDHTQPPPQK